MGIVCKAEDLKLHRAVALKFLPRAVVLDKGSRQRFLMEARAAAAISHPNICTTHDIHDQEESPFIEMEYVDGQDLRALSSQGPVEPLTALPIAIQVTDALEEAHRKGIVHRDIKSANIMVSNTGRAKVMDFGLAKVRGESLHTREGTTLGTIAYMSPEQAECKSVDHRTDLWALGVVLYELLSGQLPFSGERDTAVLYAVVHTEPVPLRDLRPDVPPQLEAIVRRALKKNPNERYSSAIEMGRDLKACLEELTSLRTATRDWRSLVRQFRRPRVAVPLALFLAFLAAAGYWLVDRQAKVRWARQHALPEIERLLEANDVWRDLTGAYRLAVKAEEYIPGDPALTALLARCSLRINIRTDPPGATVQMKLYNAPDSEWEYLGLTPLEKIRVPIGVFRWKLEKEGFEPVLAASSTWDIAVASAGDLLVPSDLVRRLDTKESAPPGMVRVPATKTTQGDLPAFFIDRFEVTNRQYKEFVDRGAYRDRKLWKHPFVLEGKLLQWEEAMARFVDQTGRPGPATWQAGDYPPGQHDYPASGLSWYEAAAYAESVGKSLPTAAHWNVARGAATPMIRWPQLGGFAILASGSNFQGQGPLPAGKLHGITPFGAYDMAGNVREWCWNETSNGRAVRGGGWDDATYMFGNLSQVPPLDRSAKNGFRCALYPEPAQVPSALFQPEVLSPSRDYYTENPVSDAVFQVYKEQFSYDPSPLNARVESRQDRPGDWIHERITFDAAYGGERVIAHLFLPANSKPPYQTVIYFPGSASVFQPSSQDIENYYEFPMFLAPAVKSGRAALYPVYKGTFERKDTSTALIHQGDGSRLFSEYFIRVVKDLRRSIDYLETREDIDSGKLAFYGMSWGGLFAATIPAVENRLRANVVLSGGLKGRYRPEVDPINYITRVKIPTLMLNGKYDTILPPDTSQKPMFDLLGSSDKQWKRFESDHIPPRNDFIREILTWLDRQFGPVH